MQILIFDIELYHIKVYMVAGGWYRPNLNVSSKVLDSVELFVLGHSAWQQAESLPIEINGPGAAVIDNVPYFFGIESFMFQCFHIFISFVIQETNLIKIMECIYKYLLKTIIVMIFNLLLMVSNSFLT